MKTKPSSVEEIRKQTKNLIDAHKKSIQDFHENHFPHLFGMEGKMMPAEMFHPSEFIKDEMEASWTKKPNRKQ